MLLGGLQQVKDSTARHASIHRHRGRGFVAYATTIHKSQGSEYPVVIIPLLMTHFVMLQRNLVYTGITRAKRLCILVGTTKALAYAIHNQTVQKRNTRLKERLHEGCCG